MAWTYRQSTGELISYDGRTAGTGYSGAGAGKNNPTFENVRNVGPIPKGDYSIAAPVDTVTHGPYVLALRPAPANQMYGRSGFLMHSDSVVHPGAASEGCIVIAHSVREQCWNSGDHTLEVVA